MFTYCKNGIKFHSYDLENMGMIPELLMTRGTHIDSIQSPYRSIQADNPGVENFWSA